MAYTDEKEYQVTDTKGETWSEHLTDSEVAQYKSWGWTVSPK